LCWGLLKETRTAQQCADDFFQSAELLLGIEMGKGRKVNSGRDGTPSLEELEVIDA
jgi:hypothetical protein